MAWAPVYPDGRSRARVSRLGGLGVVADTALSTIVARRLQCGDPGGHPADMPGKRCLCNGLVAGIGLGQTRRDSYQEPPILTSGDDLSVLLPFLRPGRSGYGAADVVRHLLPASAAGV